MGALHKGHLALIRDARQQNSHVVVSVFVNPLQFGKEEDLTQYPRSLEQDIEMCRTEAVDLVFTPSIAEMYPFNDATRVVPPKYLVSGLCGPLRPNHFTGVLTVAAKLFNIVGPDTAYFGEKDYQQLTVVRNMVQDLNFPVKIVAVPTVREADGFALSSRNIYLNAEQRKIAPTLYKVLCEVVEETTNGKEPLDLAIARGRNKINTLSGVTLQYLEACDCTNLQPLTKATVPMIILVAAKIGNVRLIDNVIVRN